MSMTANTYYDEQSRTKHGYELQGYREAGRETSFIIVGRYVSEDSGEKAALRLAVKLMAEDDTILKMRVYHTHPSPGPVRRFLAVVDRDGVFRYSYDQRVAHKAASREAVAANALATE